MKLLVSLFTIGLLFAGENTATYKVDGMMCKMNCPSKVVDAVKALEGVKNCDVNFDSKTAVVTFDNDKIDSEKIATVMAEATYYKVTPMNKENNKSESWFSRFFKKS